MTIEAVSVRIGQVSTYPEEITMTTGRYTEQQFLPKVTGSASFISMAVAATAGEKKASHLAETGRSLSDSRAQPLAGPSA